MNTELNVITIIDHASLISELSDTQLHYLECVYAHKVGEKFKPNTKRILEVIRSSGMCDHTLKEFMDRFDLFNQPPRNKVPIELLT